MNSVRIVRTSVVAAMAAQLAFMAIPSAAVAEEGHEGREHGEWKFAVSDDSRASGGAAAKNNGVSVVVMSAIAKDIAAQGVDFVLFPGDMVTGETNDSVALDSMLKTWKSVMAPVYDAGIPVYVTRGNHEYNPGANGAANPVDPSKGPFLAEFSSLPQNGPSGEQGFTWSLTHKNAKIIGFDQYIGRSASYNNGLYAPGSNHGQAMNPWVVDEITKSRKDVNFVIAHEQMWPSISHSDCLANDPDSRDALVHALGTHHGVYLAGHDHMYVRGYMTNDAGDKVPSFVVGTGGGGNYDYTPFDAVKAGYTGTDRYVVEKTLSSSANPTFGYLLVTVHADGTFSAEFRGFQFVLWNDPTNVSLTPWSVWDSFRSTSMLKH
jgi:Calcineurin-like phosphoesterase